MNKSPNQEFSQKNHINFREMSHDMDSFLQITRNELISLIESNNPFVYSSKSRVINFHRIFLNFVEDWSFFVITFPNFISDEEWVIPDHVIVKDPLIANEAFRYACNMAKVIPNFKQLFSVVDNYVQISQLLKDKTENS